MRVCPSGRSWHSKQATIQRRGEGFEPSRRLTTPNGFRDLPGLSELSPNITQAVAGYVDAVKKRHRK
jgi:hypothetical protein